MNSPVIKTFVALLFVGLIIVWAAWPSRLPPPDEANRYIHPDGYSIIMPPKWRAEVERQSSTLVTTNHGWLRILPIQDGYYTPSLMILVMPDPPDLIKLKSDERFIDGTFRGAPVLLRSGPLKKYWAYEMVFQDQDRWFQFNLSTPDFNDITKSGWQAYLNSFKYDPKASTAEGVTTQATLKFTATAPAETKMGPTTAPTERAEK